MGLVPSLHEISTHNENFVAKVRRKQMANKKIVLGMLLMRPAHYIEGVLK
jgi:hypothetical protein